MTDPEFGDKYSSLSSYVSHICSDKNLMKRTVNSIRNEIQGRMNALMELKKTELREVSWKAEALEEKISKIKKELDTLKKKAVANTISEKDLRRYRRLKESLYWKLNKLNRLTQKKKSLEYTVSNKIYKMCFGSKRMLNKQHLLEENGYKTREKWHNDFVKTRDKNIFFLGSCDEACGNQMCQMMYDKKSDAFSITIRKEYKYSGDVKESKYVTCKGIKFRHLKNEIIEALESQKPVSFRFRKAGNKWYVQVIFSVRKTGCVTRTAYGAIGLDYNNGFIEMSETDSSGNLVHQAHFDLRYHGTGKKAENEIRETTSEIIKYAVHKGKDVIAENLNFKKAKAKQLPSNKKQGTGLYL